MNELERLNYLAAVTTIRAAMVKKLKVQDSEDRDELKNSLTPGMRLPAIFRGQQVGSVTLANPSDKAKVVDQYALMAWALEHMPFAIQPRIHDMDAAIDFLKEHAPELVVESIPDHHLATMCRRAESGEEIPGIEITPGKPYVTVASKKAEGVVTQMLEETFANFTPQVEDADQKELEK